MPQIKIVSNNLLGKCRQFLAQNPIANILPLGDLYLPLFRVSTLYSAIKDNRVIGVCSVYHAFPKPSVVLGAETAEIKKALLERALEHVSDEFISLCQNQTKSKSSKNMQRFCICTSNNRWLRIHRNK